MSKKAAKQVIIIGEVFSALSNINKVKVTQADINKGQKGDGEYCPIACAVRRTLGPFAKGAEISVNGAGNVAEIVTTVPVQMTVSGKKVKVGELNVTGNLNIGAKKQVSKFIRDFDGKGAKAVKPVVIPATFQTTYADIDSFGADTL